MTPKRTGAAAPVRPVDRLRDVRVDPATGLHVGTIDIGAQQLRVGIRPLAPGIDAATGGPAMLLFNGIGANTTIDRGALDDTIIEDGVKLDNQIQIGHNVRVGAHTAMAGCVGIAGSARIGRRCTVGGGAIILGHLTIADGVNISAATLVTRSINQPGTYTGAMPFESHGGWLRNAAHMRHLDAMAEKIRELEARLAQLERKT